MATSRLSSKACKQQDVLSKLTSEREQAVQRIEAFVSIASSIPGIDSHDAQSLKQVIGSIEAITKASKGVHSEKY